MRGIVFILAVCGLTACGSPTPQNASDFNAGGSSVSSVLGASEKGARVIFHKDNFTDLSDFVVPEQTSYKCLGDILKVYYVTGQDYLGAPTSFPLNTAVIDSLAPTTRPAFIKNISVDITNTYFPMTVANALSSDACTYRSTAGAAPPTGCADFDEAQTVTPSPTIAPTPTPTVTPVPSVTPVPTPTPVPSPTPYFGSKFYRVRDDYCAGQGPVISANRDTTKTYVGGVNIDLDRTALGVAEDLLMNITYQSYNANAAWPTVMGNQDETILEVNLVGTALGLDTLMNAKQPRPWNDYASASIPVYLKHVATLRDPTSSLRTEQVYLPVSGNSLIDRIRIERVRGSYHLYQIDLYRLGNRAN